LTVDRERIKIGADVPDIELPRALRGRGAGGQKFPLGAAAKE
jgi:hypothetical protein